MQHVVEVQVQQRLGHVGGGVEDGVIVEAWRRSGAEAWGQCGRRGSIE